MMFEVQNVAGTAEIVANMLLSIKENNSAEARCWSQTACKLLSMLHGGQRCLDTFVLQLLPRLSPRNAHLPVESQG